MVSSPLMSALVERQNTAASEVGPCMMRGLNANSDVLIQLATNKKQEEGRKELAINGTGDNTDENVHGTNANRKETSKAPNNMLSEKEAAEHIAEIVGKVIASQRQANGNECDKVNTTVQDVENHSDTGTSASDGNDGVVPNTLAEKQKREFQEWMSRHGNNLYPSRQDKEQLADQLGISYLQVTRLLANFRRRHLKYKRCAQLAQAKNEQNMDSFEHEQPSVRNAETTQVDNSVLQGEPTILNFHEEHEDNDYPPTKVPRMDIAEESSGKADELERQRRIDETIHSIFSRVFNSEGHIEEEHRERILEPASNEGDAVAAILQLQAHGTSHKESVLCSPPPASANYVTGSENPMTNNKQNHLLGQQFSPTMGPTGFGQFNCQQVVPELTSNSMGVMTSPPHHQHPHSVLLTPPSESHGHQHPHPQAFQAFSEKQQHEVAQQLAFQHLNALQAPQQQSINMNSLLAALAQQQSSLAGNSAPTSNGNLLTQIPMSVHPNQALLYAAVMAQTQAGSTSALQSLLQQQLASNYENGQHQTAAQASVMMQLAIQKELQILYQRQHLHNMLTNAAAVAQQRQSPQQSQMTAQQPIQQHQLNFVSPPLTHTPASDEASYATSSPHSFATSSSSMTGSSEGSRSSPPPPSMTFRHAQNQMNCEAAFGSPPPTATEANYGDCDAFEQTNATHHVNDLNEKPERRLTEKEMQAIHSLINLREGGNTSANSHN